MPSDESTPEIFSIRFIGEQLDRENLPIYELGQVFIGVQRLFHKAYLAEQERLEKRAFPDKAERRKLALQIGSHSKGSDFYALIPFLSDPTFVPVFKTLGGLVISGLRAYVRKKVVDYLRDGSETKGHIYVGSIHAEVVNIVDRIDGISGCESIQIGCPQSDTRPILLDSEIRKYAREVTGESYLGSVQRLHGSAYKLYPNIDMIEIRRRPGNKKCKLFLRKADFERIRYRQITSPLVTVIGRPRFRIGTERHSFDEFEVTKVVSIEDDDGLQAKLF